MCTYHSVDHGDVREHKMHLKLMLAVVVDTGVCCRMVSHTAAVVHNALNDLQEGRNGKRMVFI